MLENEIIDQRKNELDARQNIDNRKLLKLSTKRKQRLLKQGASTQDIINSTIRPSLRVDYPSKRKSVFEQTIRSHVKNPNQ